MKLIFLHHNHWGSYPDLRVSRIRKYIAVWGGARMCYWRYRGSLIRICLPALDHVDGLCTPIDWEPYISPIGWVLEEDCLGVPGLRSRTCAYVPPASDPT